jgi:hypothetical protein
MATNFIDRLRSYYLNVAKVLRGEADAAAVFPNPTDKGGNRELIYAEFLRQHAPSKCRVFLGGYLFDEDGNESKQLDVIVTTDTTPRFDLHNTDGKGKSFSPVEGCLGAVSVKSQLNKDGILDALEGIASIPPTRSLEGRVNPMLTIRDYDRWPLKVVYATDGVSCDTAKTHISDFYSANPGIPPSRRPEYIHVLGKYVLALKSRDLTLRASTSGREVEFSQGHYFSIEDDSDLHAIVRVLNKLQSLAALSSQINFDYLQMFNRVAGQMWLSERTGELEAPKLGGSVIVTPSPFIEPGDS